MHLTEEDERYVAREIDNILEKLNPAVPKRVMDFWYSIHKYGEVLRLVGIQEYKDPKFYNEEEAKWVQTAHLEAEDKLIALFEEIMGYRPAWKQINYEILLPDRSSSHPLPGVFTFIRRWLSNIK